MKMRHAAIALVLALALGACDSSTSSPPSVTNTQALQTWAASVTDLSLPGDSNFAPSSVSAAMKEKWDSVVNLQRFKTEANADLARILADWASRNPVVSAWTEVNSTDTMVTGVNGWMKLVRFTVDGVSQGGLAWVPKASGSHPVILVGHPGDQGVTATLAATFGALMGAARLNNTILLFPAYRGETAYMLNDSVAGDPATASPWDRDVDDGLAMLQASLDRMPGADASRIVAFGFSRGAGVSLIAALRDKRIKAVFEIAGPTDFLAPSIQLLAFQLAGGGTVDLPGVNYISGRYVMPYWNGAIPADSIRTALLRRSVARMARSGLLPTTQAIHGSADVTVYPEQTRHLALADARVDTLFVPGMTHTSWFSAPVEQMTIGSRLQTFLQANLGN